MNKQSPAIPDIQKTTSPKVIFLQKSYLLVLLAAFWLFLTIDSARNEFSRMGVFILWSYVGTLLAMEYLFLSFLHRKHPRASNYGFAALTAINLFSLHVVLIIDYARAGALIQLSALLFGFLIFLGLYHAFDRDRSIRNSLTLLTTLAILITVGSLEFSHQHSVLTEPSKRIKKVLFKNKPNIYFIAFDGLIPEAIAAQYDIHQVPYVDILRKSGARLFKNAFADDAPTFNSLNSLVTLDVTDWESNDNNKMDYVLGHSNGALYNIMRTNGYQTHFYFKGPYFGRERGAYLDHYLMFNPIPDCFFQHGVRRNFSYLGYCRLINSSMAKEVLGSPTWMERLDFLLGYFQKTIDSQAPNFHLVYLFFPGHTDLEFDVEDPNQIALFRHYYSIASQKTAFQILQILSFIKYKDPEAILFIFGDHGAYLTRGKTLAGAANQEEINAIMQDRNGVTAAVYPGDTCTQSLDRPYTTEYITNSQIALMLIRCLAGGEDPLQDPSIESSKMFKDFTKFRYE